MKTNTTPAAQQRAELLELEGKHVQLQMKRDQAVARLSELKAEIATIARDVAAEKTKTEEIDKCMHRIQQTETLIVGFDDLLRQSNSAMAAKTPAVIQLESNERLAARIKRRDEVMAHGEKVVARINEKLRDLIVNDLVELDQIRDELNNGFRDLAGREMQTVLCRSLNLENGVLVVDHQLTDRGAWHDRQLWQRRGDVVLKIQNLTPPKK